MLVIKSLHIAMVVSWFAGLFYLPRIFVNLAMVPADSSGSLPVQMPSTPMNLTTPGVPETGLVWRWSMPGA